MAQGEAGEVGEEGLVALHNRLGCEDGKGERDDED